MKYTNSGEADLLLKHARVLEYPNYKSNLSAFPPIEGNIGAPSKLLVESMHLLGREPRRILEVGAHTCLNGLYLAYHGHRVTAIDTDGESLEFAREKAREIGIADENFIPKRMDVRQLASSSRYGAILLQMVLHCMPEPDAAKTAANMKSITVEGGLNISSVFTDRNPEEEITIRGLAQLPTSSWLNQQYWDPRWRMLRSEQGLSPDKSDRSWLFGKDLYLVPHIAEVVARKGF